MRTWVGCSGYFYRHWAGRFYPDGLPMHRWFAHYASVFDTVELNASFYRFPTPAAARRWRRQAPEGFLYAVKAPRVITHLRKLAHCDEHLARLRDALEELGDKLGPVLFQLPPKFEHCDEHLERLEVLTALPWTVAVEFRHPSWWREDVHRWLDERGLIFVSVDAPELPDRLLPCAQGIYLRMHGRPWYRERYTDDALTRLTRRLKDAAPRRAWIYFNNDHDAAAPDNARTLARMLAGEVNHAG